MVINNKELWQTLHGKNAMANVARRKVNVERIKNTLRHAFTGSRQRGRVEQWVSTSVSKNWGRPVDCRYSQGGWDNHLGGGQK